MTSLISSLVRIWKIHHSCPGCSFVWILRVVYFPLKHSCLYNKINFATVLIWQCQCAWKLQAIAKLLRHSQKIGFPSENVLFWKQVENISDPLPLSMLFLVTLNVITKSIATLIRVREAEVYWLWECHRNYEYMKFIYLNCGMKK